MGRDWETQCGRAGSHLAPPAHKNPGGKDHQRHFHGYLSPLSALMLNLWMRHASMMGLHCNENLTSHKGTSGRELFRAESARLDNSLKRGVGGREMSGMIQGCDWDGWK